MKKPRWQYAKEKALEKAQGEVEVGPNPVLDREKMIGKLFPLRELTRGQALRWEPQPEHVQTIYEYACLGWPLLRIVESFGLTKSDWIRLAKRFPEMKGAFIDGVAYRARGFKDRLNSWLPEKGDVETVLDLASRGHTIKAIAAAIGCPLKDFVLRLKDTPELAEAYEFGQGAFDHLITEKLMQNAEAGDDTALIFLAKARGEWNERQNNGSAGLRDDGAKPLSVIVNIPKDIPIGHSAEYAVEEIARAAKIKQEKMLAIEQRQDDDIVIPEEVKVVDDQE